MRESKTAHSVPKPDLSNLDLQVQEAIQLNNDGKFDSWKSSTLTILRKYIPGDVKNHEIISSVRDVCGHTSWKACTEFVQDDRCSEFFNYALSYCLKEGQVHKKTKGFIDGSGIGYEEFYLKRLKVTIEECFDAKYFYKLDRPLKYIFDNYKGLDLTAIANKIHPGHWAYPAGHGTKFLTVVEVMRKIFHLDKNCSRALFIAACVESMARSGSLIHYPGDNLAGGYLTTLKEFKKAA